MFHWLQLRQRLCSL